jgi:hypothetical protein
MNCVYNIYWAYGKRNEAGLKSTIRIDDPSLSRRWCILTLAEVIESLREKFTAHLESGAKLGSHVNYTLSEKSDG